MKKLIAILLSILMVLLIFASCDTGGEEVSGEPVSEVSSVEISSVEVSSKEEQSKAVVFNKSLIKQSDEEDYALYVDKDRQGYTLIRKSTGETIYQIKVDLSNVIDIYVNDYGDMLVATHIDQEKRHWDVPILLDTTIPLNRIFSETITEEDYNYFIEYKDIFASGIKFESPRELDGNDLMYLHVYMTGANGGVFKETFNPISETMEGDKKYSFKVKDVEKVLQTYLGDYPFADKLRKDIPTEGNGWIYKADSDTIEVGGGYYGIGGLVGLNMTPVPIERNGNEVTIYVAFANPFETAITGGLKIRIEEFEGGFHYLSGTTMTEDEVAALNSKYFREVEVLPEVLIYSEYNFEGAISAKEAVEKVKKVIDTEENLYYDVSINPIGENSVHEVMVYQCHWEAGKGYQIRRSYEWYFVDAKTGEVTDDYRDFMDEFN